MFFFCYVMVNLLINIMVVLMDQIVLESREWAAGIASLVFFAIYNGYFIVLEWLMNGQTPGKRLLHIRVIKQGRTFWLAALLCLRSLTDKSAWSPEFTRRGSPGGSPSQSERTDI